MQLYVRPSLAPSAPAASAADGQWTISKGGSNTMVGWRADGKELWYTTADGRLMGVDVTMSQTFSAGEPKLLFQPPPGTIAAATNGDRFLLARAGQRKHARAVHRDPELAGAAEEAREPVALANFN